MTERKILGCTFIRLYIICLRLIKSGLITYHTES